MIFQGGLVSGGFVVEGGSVLRVSIFCERSGATGV